jgi:hypothetical protein
MWCEVVCGLQNLVNEEALGPLCEGGGVAPKTTTICSFSTCAPDGHLQTVTIPDAVLIQFDLLMMSTTVLETCRGI